MCKQIQHVSDGPEIWFIRVLLTVMFVAVP